MKTIIGLAVLASLALPAPAAEDYSTWAHTKAVTVNTTGTGGGANLSAGVAGFPVLVRLTSAQSEIFTQAKAGGADIRFRRLPGPALPYQIERWDTAAKAAEIWVRLDTVIANNAAQTFNIYWGKSTAADSSSGAAVFDTAGGYQGVWHFAGSLNDATRNAYDGTDNGTTDAAGAIGRGRDFNGSSNVSLGNPAKMSSGDADRFTVETWVNWTSIGTGSADRYRCIINHGTTNNADQFFMYARNPSSGGTDPQYTFGYYTGSASNNALLNGIGTDAGTWVHVTGVYDGTNWTLYRNGVLGATAPKDGSPVNASADWLIGSWGTSRFFLGGLDEIRFSNRARSDAWIKLAYETQKAGATALTFGATQTPTSLRDAEVSFTGSFAILPSASGVAFVLPEGSGRARLSVTDARGALVWSREVELSGTATRVARNGLPAGMYAARVVLQPGGEAGRGLRKSFTVAR